MKVTIRYWLFLKLRVHRCNVDKVVLVSTIDVLCSLYWPVAIKVLAATWRTVSVQLILLDFYLWITNENAKIQDSIIIHLSGLGIQPASPGPRPPGPGPRSRSIKSR